MVELYSHRSSVSYLERFFCRMFGPDAAMLAFHDALKHVAKSGEVWCEGARIYMNPTSSHFHLLNASKCLNYAVFFTPQYGDSFIEVCIEWCLRCRQFDSIFYHPTSSFE